MTRNPPVPHIIAAGGQQQLVPLPGRAGHLSLLLGQTSSKLFQKEETEHYFQQQFSIVFAMAKHEENFIEFNKPPPPP